MQVTSSKLQRLQGINIPRDVAERRAFIIVVCLPVKRFLG